MTTFLVSNTNDGGAGSLRMAIQQVDGDHSPDVIQFAIGSGAQVIEPASALPAITNTVTIDGTSQPGYVDKPVITINGTDAGSDSDGLTILADDSTVKGLGIIDFGGNGITFEGANSHSTLIGGSITSDYIGVDPGSLLAAGNSGDGVFLALASDVAIGQPGAGNLIGGNSGSGIHLERSSGSALIQGNFIGEANGGSGINVGNLGNQGDGIFLQAATAVTIGGSTTGDGNLISANSGNGVNINNGSANLIQGNLIGTDADGLEPRPNGADGVFVGDSPGNIVGGTDPGAANVLSGNAGNGVEIGEADSKGNLVLGNDIGVELDGQTILGNSSNGVDIDDGASGNSLVGNTISGNKFAGVSINTMASGNSLRGNFIGTDPGGDDLANVTDGVFVVQSPGNTIGGTTPADRNVIGGNVANGISLRGPATTGNLVEGDDIGLIVLPGGAQNLGNNQTGILIQNAPSNTIGGTSAGSRNVISANGTGVAVVTTPDDELGSLASLFTGGTSADDVIQGNYIGTTPDGESVFNNLDDGILITGGVDTQVGGTAPGAGNLISSNFGNGINLEGVPNGNDLSAPPVVPTSGNLIQGNIIGLDALGTSQLGNGHDGIFLNVVTGTTIGGTTPGAGNTISGNASGVEIFGLGNGSPTSLGTLVEGNVIGLGVDGKQVAPLTSGGLPLGNTANGIGVELGATDVTIGGTAPGAGNIISGNGSSGIALSGASTGVLIEGNFIGTAKDGLTQRSNTQAGIFLDQGSNHVTVGGTAFGAGNLISGNSSGVTITDDGTVDNLFQGNIVGLGIDGSTSIGNVAYGFLLLGGADGNTIGGPSAAARNVISSNGQGITEDGPGLSGDVIQGNYIGLDATGSLAKPNDRAGIAVNDSGGNTIGGTLAGAGNVISANTGPGLVIDGATATGNLVLGNLVGTDATGRRPLGNVGFGIQIDNAPSNTIGGPTPSARNLVSGNGQAGIEIDGLGSAGNQVEGNLVGTDITGLLGLGNSADGILVNGAPANLIGGTTGLEANVISANLGNGIQIAGAGSAYNQVLGNLIGTDATGGGALGNQLSGILVTGAPGVTIGGTIDTLRNVISANLENGVRVSGSGSSGTVVLGNLIGTDATGRDALGNFNDGVFLDQAVLVTVGGTTPGSTNVISGNGSSGIEFGGASTYFDEALGNLVGTDYLGTIPLANSIGIFVNNSPFDQVGGTAPFSGNLVSGNAGPGVEIFGVAALDDSVQGNRIGTDLAGLVALANQAGVFIDGAPDNLVGGLAPASGNLLSGNLTGGVVVQGSAATHNLIQGNLIGPDITGGRAIGPVSTTVSQQQSGILLDDAPGNVVGGSVDAGRNVVSGNVAGVVISGFNAQGNLVLGNFLGLDATGRFAVPNEVGAYINGSSGNTIGGSTPGSANVISGNSSTGVSFFGALTTLNVVSGNRIGTNQAGTAAVPNQTGVFLETSDSNTIGGPTPAAGNLISGNSVAGVYFFSDATGNLVQENRIGFTAAGGPLRNDQYGILLYNAASNDIDMSPTTGNKIGNSGIGNFREFTGPAPTTTSTTTTSSSAAVKKSSAHPAGPRTTARR